jgi:hypothetical protein
MNPMPHQNQQADAELIDERSSTKWSMNFELHRWGLSILPTRSVEYSAVQIFSTLSGKFAGSRIVATLSRQFMTRWNTNRHEQNIVLTRRHNLENKLT